MHIQFLTHYFPPEGNAPATRVHALAKRWVAAGHRVTVITNAPNVPDGKVYQGYQNKWHVKEEIAGIEVHRCWSYIAANKGAFKRIVSFLSYMCMAIFRGCRVDKPDVIVATSPQFFCGWAGVWVSRLRRVPFILEIRDIWPESIAAVGALGQSEQQFKKSLFMRYFEWLEKRMYHAAESLVTVGDGYKKKLMESPRDVPATSIAVFPNGVDLSRYQPQQANQALREEVGASPEDFLVGYIGTVGMAHGLDVVLRAGHLAKEKGFAHIKFVVVGDGALHRKLTEELAQNNPGNVCFVGRKPKQKIPEWLASTDACLVHLRNSPLFQTVLPSKIFEAIGMKKPVLLGVGGQARQLIAEAKAGTYFEPENEAELLRAIEALQAHAEQDIDLEHAYQWVAEHYNIDELARSYEQYLQTFCDMTRV